MKENECCGKPIKETGNDGCCDETEESVVQENNEGCGCSCGGEFPDESLISNPDKPEFTADPEIFEEFEDIAHKMGIVNVGYTQIIPELIITDNPKYSNAIVLTLEMGEDIIKAPPSPEAQELNDATYAKLGHITYALSDFIRAKGFATEVAHPYGSLVNFSYLGQKAGLGLVGQSGLLITPELGSRLKISAILTSIENLPIKKSDDYSWIIEYCEKCGKCIKACQEDALIEKEGCCGKEIVLKSNLCIGCIQGCTYCIESCPFVEKGYEHVKNKHDKITAKLKEKKVSG
jgi:epoxyqueuosine reductase QueG